MANYPTHDVAIKVVVYKDRQTGDTKTRYKNIGTLFTNEDGEMFLSVDATILSASVNHVANHDANDRVFFSLFNKQRDQQGAGQQHGGAATDPTAASLGASAPPAQGYQQPPQQGYQQRGGQQGQQRGVQQGQQPRQEAVFDDDIPF